MSSTSLFSQVIMIGVAIAIGLMYIKPTIEDIKQRQDSIELYRNEAAKASAVNQELASKVAKVDSVPLASKQALAVYVPETIDEIKVLKDLKNIVELIGITPSSLAFGGIVAAATTDDGSFVEESNFSQYAFTLAFQSSYEDLKALLAAFEVNDYLIQVQNMAVAPSESGQVSVTLSLRVFTMPVIEETEETEETEGSEEYFDDTDMFIGE